MEEVLDENLLYYFINFGSAIYALAKAESGKKGIDIRRVHDNLNNLFAGIENFYKANPKQRQAGLNYCNEGIAKAKGELSSADYDYKELRIEYLNTIEEGINRIFSQDGSVKNVTAKKNKTELTSNQIILILYYTGMLEAINEVQANTTKAELLNAILGGSSQNIREALTYIGGDLKKNRIKTKKNLTAIKELFDNLNLGLYSNKVSEELNQLD